MSPIFVWASLAAFDAGSADAATLSPEDQELLQDLELLQNLEGAQDLDLLQELSVDR